MKTAIKERHEMSIAELIVDSGWWLGTEQEWRALSMPEREDIAFIRTGCRVAYPTWERPVDCVHLECRIRRGELPQIALTNAVLRGERETGWLRFNENRNQVAKIFVGLRRLARQSGKYNPWDIDGAWRIFVGAALLMLLLISGPASKANTVTARDIDTACQSEGPTAQGICVSYIRAVLDQMQSFPFFAPARQKVLTVRLNDGVTASQVGRCLAQYLHNNPKFESSPANQVIIDVLIDARLITVLDATDLPKYEAQVH